MTLLSAVEAVEETPVDRFLAEQADLSAVERFSQRHEAQTGPRQERYYRDLIPLGRPESGQQYGFEVDLDACTGCKSCVAACHSLNGLDEDEAWRSVTVIRGGTAARPFQQTVTAACHHCVDPACLNGCPVDAYQKDPVTGIVSHLDDQCIGCSYCTLSCPYEVPQFNKRLGIVRKCDMCSGRLAAGEAPACVQACPNGAIAIKVVDVASAVATATTGSLVPGAPPSAITVPTTVYRSTNQRVLGVDNRNMSGYPPRERRDRAHTPLAVMLVLTQLAVGAFMADILVRSAGPFHTLVAVAAVVVALAASTLHLGRPQYAYRAVIGLRHSWLSREVVAFGAFTALGSLHALAPSPALGLAASACGLFGVTCSVLIYTSTHRWRPSAVVARFGITTVTGGIAVASTASLHSAAAVLVWTAALAAAVAAQLVERERFFTRMPRPRER